MMLLFFRIVRWIFFGIALEMLGATGVLLWKHPIRVSFQTVGVPVLGAVFCLAVSLSIPYILALPRPNITTRQSHLRVAVFWLVLLSCLAGAAFWFQHLRW